MVVCQDGTRDESPNRNDPTRKREGVTHRVTVAFVNGKVHAQETAKSNEDSEE